MRRSKDLRGLWNSGAQALAAAAATAHSKNILGQLAEP